MEKYIYEILLFFILNIISIFIFIHLSPILDHAFGDFEEEDKNKNDLEIIINVSLHICILALLFILYYNFIEKLISTFNIRKYISNTILQGIIKRQSDLIIVFSLIELQINMKNKLKYLSDKHFIRS